MSKFFLCVVVCVCVLILCTTKFNFSEILRAIDSLQLTDNKKVATPADWKVNNYIDCAQEIQ